MLRPIIQTLLYRYLHPYVNFTPMSGGDKFNAFGQFLTSLNILTRLFVRRHSGRPLQVPVNLDYWFRYHWTGHSVSASY